MNQQLGTLLSCPLHHVTQQLGTLLSCPLHHVTQQLGTLLSCPLHHVTQQFCCKQPLGHFLLQLNVLLNQYFVRKNTILLGCYAMSTGMQ
jgi:hypothetical protein